MNQIVDTLTPDTNGLQHGMLFSAVHDTVTRNTTPLAVFQFHAAMQGIQDLAFADGHIPAAHECKGSTGIGRSGTKAAATVNERMAGTIMENAEAMGWNSTKWARELKCAKSSVVTTAAWKKLESARLQAKAERMKDRRRKPKASDSRRD